MLKIGEFSKLTKTTVKMLRYYDKLNILKPAFIDSDTSYRYYTEEQVETAQRIQKLKSVGLPYEKIQSILQYENDSPETLILHKEELKNKKIEIEEQLSKLEFLIENREMQEYKPVLENIDSRTVYCSQSFIKDVNHIIDFIKLTLKELKKTNPDVGFPENDYCCIIYPDDSYRDTNIFVEYVQSVDRAGEDTPVIKFKILEAATAISVTHYGGYENLHDAYLSAVNYAIENGYRICGNPRERYLRGSWNCDKKEEWETVVQIPVMIK